MMRCRTKAAATMVAGALLLIGLVIALIWKMIEIERCYDKGGIVVAPLMRDQACVMPKSNPTASSSRR